MEAMKYGSREWIERQYADSSDDPWGLDWRPSQKYRYLHMIEALRQALVAIPPPLAIIDVGCATGAFTAMLAALNADEAGGGLLVGVDIAEAAVARAAARYPAIRFERMALDECSRRFRGSADVVTCMEVLYYLPPEQRAQAVAQLRQMLRPGGYLVVSSMIASAPYFSLAQLESLVAAELGVVSTGKLHLKPVVLWEKLLMKLRGRPAADRIGEFDYGKIDRWGRLSQRLLGQYAQSHGYVIARDA